MANNKKEEEVVVTPKKIDIEEKKFYWEEPIDKDHTDPIWVSINGKTTMIQRGVRVEVSKPVYEVLLNRREMNKLALERSMKLQQDSRF